MKIAYLGPKGSFTYTASHAHFGDDNLQAYATISACIKAVDQGEVNLGIVPIENTIEGTVNLSLDSLYHKAELKVIGELVMPIAQQLLVNDNLNMLSEIETVYSHPQAIAQCQEFIAEHLTNAELVTTDSTSSAAKFVSEHRDLNIAAIGPRTSGLEYGLTVKEENIQDIPHNKTRFWIISKQPLPEKVRSGKASLCFTMPNNLPGALQKALTTFSWRGINLSKIESRPLKTQLGEYFFLVDISYEAQQDLLLRNAVMEIESLGGKVKKLGIYPVTVVKAL